MSKTLTLLALLVLAASMISASPPTTSADNGFIATANTAIIATEASYTKATATMDVNMNPAPRLAAGCEATNDYSAAMKAATATTANTPPAPEVAFNVICPQDAMAAATASDEHRLLTGAPRKILDAVDNTDATVFRFAAVAV